MEVFKKRWAYDEGHRPKERRPKETKNNCDQVIYAILDGILEQQKNILCISKGKTRDI